MEQSIGWLRISTRIELMYVDGDVVLHVVGLDEIILEMVAW